MAARRNDTAIVKLLIEYGADASQRDSGCISPLEWAKFHNNAEMVAAIEYQLLNSPARTTSPPPR